jgi:valyl-tRNA synthetase
VRYWAASARLGTDTAFDEQVMKVGKRLVTKLFNAGKFVLAQPGVPGAIASELDRAFVHRLRRLIDDVTASFEAFDYAHALQATEAFFWHDFTDTFLELVKPRTRADGAASGSGVAALRLGLDVLLRLFAPALPFITEEIWSWAFAGASDTPSIHRAPWPGAADFAGIAPPADAASFDAAVAGLAAVNKAKSEASVSVGRGVLHLRLGASPDTLAHLEPVVADVMAAARVARHELVPRAGLGDGVFDVLAAEFAPLEE